MTTGVHVSVTIEFSPVDSVTITWEEHYGRWHASEFDTMTGEHRDRPDLNKLSYTGVSTATARILDHPEDVRGNATIVPRLRA